MSKQLRIEDLKEGRTYFTAGLLRGRVVIDRWKVLRVFLHVVWVQRNDDALRTTRGRYFLRTLRPTPLSAAREMFGHLAERAKRKAREARQAEREASYGRRALDRFEAQL